MKTSFDEYSPVSHSEFHLKIIIIPFVILSAVNRPLQSRGKNKYQKGVAILDA